MNIFLFTLFVVFIFWDFILSRKFIVYSDYLDNLYFNKKEYLFFLKYFSVLLILIFNFNFFVLGFSLFYAYDLNSNLKDLTIDRNTKKEVVFIEEPSAINLRLLLDLSFLASLVYFVQVT